MRPSLALLLAFGLALAPLPARASDARLAPIPPQTAVSTHGPFEMGACDICHERADPRNPGAAAASNDLCFQCHDEFKGGARVKMERGTHPATSATICLGCHSPHNSRNKKLMLRP